MAELPVPAVSVIMPVRDVAPYLREAVESVRSQSRGDWELLIVDDGSVDDTLHIAVGFADADPRIRVLRHEGGQSLGSSAARNTGLRASRGRYIAFLDGDDIWLPGKLETMLPILDGMPEAGMLYADTTYWYSWTGRPEDQTRDFPPPLGVPRDHLLQPPELLLRILHDRAAVPCTCSAIVRRVVAERVGGFEDQFRSLFDDQVFYVKVFLTTSVYVASGCWDRYRRHPQSMMGKAKAAGAVRPARLEFLEWVGEYARATGAFHGPLRRALARAVWTTRHDRLYHLYRRTIGRVLR